MSSKIKITVFIVDDNNPNRKLIESYLSFFSQIQIIGSYSDSQDVLDEIKLKNPTAVFLDIEMPGLNGLSVASKIRKFHPNTFIIFITAHTKYAASAFQLEATDYIVKPISKVNIERAIKKVEKFLAYNESQPARTLDEILMIKNNDETYIIHPRTIIFIEKEIRKSIVHTENGKYFTSETLSSIEKKLDKSFFRCHRSYIININKIGKIVPIAERIYQIEFYNYALSASMGRKKLEELYTIIENNAVGPNYGY